MFMVDFRWGWFGLWKRLWGRASDRFDVDLGFRIEFSWFWSRFTNNDVYPFAHLSVS